LKIFVTGASGLIGSDLCADLLADGHEVTALSRQTRASGPEWVTGDASEPGGWTDAACAADAVFHLSGESVAEGRWTNARKRALIRSRVDSTRILVDAFAAAKTRPRLLVCASACGYYGPRGEEELTESSPPGSDFLARMCCEWEAEADRAEAVGMRVVKVRFGIVLSARGGALAKMLPIFRLGLGGPLGPSRRWFPWVGESDALGLLRFVLDREISGPLNAVAPGACRMGEFARTLGRALGRSAFLPVPELALKLVLGEMGGSLTPGQRVVPKAAVEAGYMFQQPTLEGALTIVVT
jgi:uncharacterized protein (TIGR01777 family)